MRLSARIVASVIAPVLSIAGIAAVAPAAHAANGDHVVINEVFAGGGSSSTALLYKNDYIELYNPTSSDVPLSGWSVQYRSATGTAAGTVTPLTGTIKAHHHFLVAESASGSYAGAPDIPTPDATGSIAMAAAGGQVWLANTTTAMTPPAGTAASPANVWSATWATPAQQSNLVDYFGGSGAVAAETAAVGTAGSTTLALLRNDTTHSDTDNNNADFTATTPTPQNSASDDGSSAGLALATVANQIGYTSTPMKSVTLAASGGTAPYTYSISGAPSGVSVNSSTGVISGIPMDDAKTYTVTATVTDSAATPVSKDQTFTFTLNDGDTADHVLVSEVWGDGGYSSGGARYKLSFIDLYNPTDNPVDLSTYSLAYVPAASSTAPATDPGTGEEQTDLSGTIPAHSFYLISGTSSSGGTGGVDLPTADATSNTNWHYADGTIALLDTQGNVTLPDGDLTGVAHVVDAVGYGSATATFLPRGYEGAVTGAATGATTAALRSPVGGDTNHNNADFTTTDPIAINSAGETFPGLSVGAIADVSVLTGSTSTLPALTGTGGVGVYTYSLSGQPSGITVNASTGVISGTMPNTPGVYTVTAKVTDSQGHSATQTFKLTVGTFVVANPGDQVFDTSTPVNLQITASGGSGYTYALTSGTLPDGLTLTSDGAITGKPTTVQNAAPVTITVTNSDSTKVAVTFNISVSTISSIASVQGVGQRSSYAPATGTSTGTTSVTTEGVVTAVWDKGYSGTGTTATLGTANSGLGGFVIQTPNNDPDNPDLSTSASNALFVYVGSAFTGVDKSGTAIQVGDSVKVSGKINEYKAASATSAESATELNSSVANTTVIGTAVHDGNPATGTSLGSVVPATTLPATYADREAHEWEAFAPPTSGADSVVVTDTYQYETDGELGLASGGTPLVQPTEICGDDNASNSTPLAGGAIAVPKDDTATNKGGVSDAACLATAEQDMVDRGYFLGDGTNTFFTTSSTHYKPYASGNSAIPLPYMDATHSARVGASVTAAAGHALILGFWPDMSSITASRSGKWYLQPERAVLGTPASSTTKTGTPDLGTDVVKFENTRADNQAPSTSNINAAGASNLRVATFNVENYFDETGEAFGLHNSSIGDSPFGTYSTTTTGCQFDYDRNGNPILTSQCISPYGKANGWDPVSGAVTSYTKGQAGAPRGAATRADFLRQTAKEVKAISGLGGVTLDAGDPAANASVGADIISLEEIENPNKMKEGITNSPLSPDLTNLKDQGQGTALANRDETLKFLVGMLNMAAKQGGATGDVWGYVKSPEESTDATSMVHLCSILNADGSNVAGNDASRANASCSYASTQDVIHTAFIYKKATVVPVGAADIDFPNNPLSPDGAGNNEVRDAATGFSPFDIAREPQAQYFKPKGYPDSDGFAVIVSHFKSKGNDTDTSGVGETGENYNDALIGSNNGNRTAQAKELVRFANEFAAKWNTDKVIMVGDFNAYTDEDPVKEVLAASKGGLDFSTIESTDTNDITYNYSTNLYHGLNADGSQNLSVGTTTGADKIGYGSVGSIDHEFISEGLKSDFTGADVWEINANETDAYDYGRFNNNATDFYYGTASDSALPACSSFDPDLKTAASATAAGLSAGNYSAYTSASCDGSATGDVYAADYAAATPFRSSDHNPMVMGLHLPALDDTSSSAQVTDVQVVGINDFHGRLQADASDGGAAAVAGAVNELRDQYGADRTIFASAGDNVGASTFASFTANDKPSLDALATTGLDVSSVGNHEFDGRPNIDDGSSHVGWHDLVNRLMKPYDATTNPYGPVSTAKDPNGLPYLAANVTYSTDPDGSGPLQAGDPIADPTLMKTIDNPLDASKPIKIGFVGTVTPDLVSLESPANLAGISVEDEEDTIATINSYADQLKSQGAQIVILLTHEGAASTDCSTMFGSGATGSFAQELDGLNDNVDAVLSGHTHLEYSCTMSKGATDSNPLTTRPVMQAGSYGVALDQLVYSFDKNAVPVSVTSNLSGVKGPVSTLFSAPEDPDVAQIVSDAVTASNAVGATVLGKLDGPFDRARLSDGTENRGGESTLGNQIAEIQRWATSSDGNDTNGAYPSAQIAFMNPGGLRADLEGTAADGSGNLTYQAAANVQPFANELTNMQLTGAQIKKVLEEQWSRDNIDNAKANIPARPFLKLGISKGFTYTYHEVTDPVHTGAKLGVVDGMWLNGQPISLTGTYSVTVNSFLASGGDNFWELANGDDPVDTEQTDLQAQVDYMKQYQDTALPEDYSQRGVGVTLTDGASTYAPGSEVKFNLTSLDMTGKSSTNPGDEQDPTVSVYMGDPSVPANKLGSCTVAHANSTQPYDDRGTASCDVTLPSSATAAVGPLTVVGDTTGTQVRIALPGILGVDGVAPQNWSKGVAVDSITPSASGGTSPYTFAVSGLPAGVTYDATSNTISGTPTTNTSGQVTITVTDNAGGSVSTSFAYVTTDKPPAVKLVGIAAKSWTVGTLIDPVTAAITGGTAPYTYTAKNLPAGLTINSATGVIEGTPTTVGSGTATISVADAAQGSSKTTLSWTVAAAADPLEIDALAAQSWTKGTAITTVTASASGGSSPYTFTATGLPAGVSISSAGAITGTPTATGSGTATVTVTDDDSATTSTTMAWTVTATPSPLTIGSLSARSWTKGAAITAVTATASGGTSPYTFTATGLPAGVHISSAGVISGTPTTVGSGSATVKVTDGDLATASTTMAWTVKAAPIVKVASKIVIKVTPKRIVAKKTKAVIKVTVTAKGSVPTGKVTITVAGKKHVVKLVRGHATLKLKFTKAGRAKITVSYAGNAKIKKSTAKKTVVVRKK